jgi:hypothetical protein
VHSHASDGGTRQRRAKKGPGPWPESPRTVHASSSTPARSHGPPTAATVGGFLFFEVRCSSLSDELLGSTVTGGVSSTAAQAGLSHLAVA